MADQDRAVERAVTAFCTTYRCAAADVVVADVRREQIPNPPLGPGQMSVHPVRYRYFVTLRSGAASERLLVEGKDVYRV